LGHVLVMVMMVLPWQPPAAVARARILTTVP
jgi:hypothetical protein